eukprot:CAMPEP_0197073556 /NCGR_PEP_ID=MMETSP1384-20130603/210663_1 /TAXON_ID=29189 /ORGANISM="Ammonia sp." /LENGTH=644 /DNA_ID=CAMNT_0042512393 /DNA_START=27 /DNA_END=1962 /DNA_ORIENTATION=-
MSARRSTATANALPDDSDEDGEQVTSVAIGAHSNEKASQQQATLKKYKVGFVVTGVLLLLMTIVVIVLAVKLATANTNGSGSTGNDATTADDTGASDSWLDISTLPSISGACTTDKCCVPLQGTTTLQAAKCYAYLEVERVQRKSKVSLMSARRSTATANALPDDSDEDDHHDGEQATSVAIGAHSNEKASQQQATLKKYKVGFVVTGVLLLLMTIVVIVLAVKLATANTNGSGSTGNDATSADDTGASDSWLDISTLPSISGACTTDKCCVPLQGTTTLQAAKCYAYLEVETCMENSESCDWDCEAAVAGLTAIKQAGIRHIYRGKALTDGIFRDHSNLSFVPSTNEAPATWQEYQASQHSVEMNACGDEFDYVMDDAVAQHLFATLNETNGTGIAAGGAADSVRRRRTIVIGTNELQRITTTAYPENVVGLLLFESSEGTYQCTATKFNRKQIITAGHCCSDGGAWFTDFRWYPGVRTVSDIRSTSAISWSSVWTFNAWLNDEDYDYDMCVITLDDYDTGNYVGWGYNNGISSSWSFDYSGFPANLSGTQYGQMVAGHRKFGLDGCTPNRAVLDNQMEYTCDTAGGMSGMSLRSETNGWPTVYCIHSWGNEAAQENGCARITEAKRTAILAHAEEKRGYETG